MKIWNILVAVLFILFAVVQFNDPDPWLWAALYGFVAVVAGMAVFGTRNRWVDLAGLIISAVWMITLIPDLINWVNMGMPTIAGSMKAEAPHIELTREFFGVLICGGTLAIYFRKAYRLARG